MNMHLPIDRSTPDLLVLELRDQIAELRERVAVGQEDLIEMARDAGAMQAELAALRAQVVELRLDRDAWRAQAERLATRVSSSV